MIGWELGGRSDLLPDIDDDEMDNVMGPVDTHSQESNDNERKFKVVA